jgi:hypothetical protein
VPSTLGAPEDVVRTLRCFTTTPGRRWSGELRHSFSRMKPAEMPWLSSSAAQRAAPLGIRRPWLKRCVPVAHSSFPLQGAPLGRPCPVSHLTARRASTEKEPRQVSSPELSPRPRGEGGSRAQVAASLNPNGIRGRSSRLPARSLACRTVTEGSQGVRPGVTRDPGGGLAAVPQGFFLCVRPSAPTEAAPELARWPAA